MTDDLTTTICIWVAWVSWMRFFFFFLERGKASGSSLSCLVFVRLVIWTRSLFIPLHASSTTKTYRHTCRLRVEIEYERVSDSPTNA
jgi:hypothetical protein